MGFGDTAKKIQQVADMAEQMYSRVNALRTEVDSTKTTVEDTGQRVRSLEAEMAEQRVILEAISEEVGVDVDAAVDAATLGDDAAGDGTDSEADKDDGSGEEPADGSDVTTAASE
jgi:hypothetical protein